jgi:NADPH:quinone reductase-like Zn-dependent oxidoreductase/acyl carrier protein
VSGFAVGDRVVAVAPDAFASFVVAKAALVAPMPPRLSFEEAAALPIAFLTATIALDDVARLGEGERVLIHAATGGVGLAAVQIASRAKAEIFATAGSDEKRARLRAMGVSHVASSRSLDFAREVRAATGGEGVDVVLNSLAGDFIATSFELLRSHGRFVEIGKRDYYENKPLGLRPFLRNLSFALVDLRSMIASRPAALGKALRAIVQQIDAGVLTPLPVEVFPIASAAAAFHHMAQAKHVGKIVLVTRDREAPIARARDAAAVRADATYLITGGLGGLGLVIAERLVAMGARHLVLMGRSGASRSASEAIARIAARGARVTIARGDVAIEADVARVLSEIASSGAPLRGVVHAAGVLEDGTIVQQSIERFERVLAPKIRGAWNLHAATRGAELDFFVLFSSIAGVLGSPGQGSYAAGSAFLDALAHHRRAHGLPATSIDWGAWGEVGLAAAEENRARRVASQGMESIAPSEGARAFEALLAAGFAQITVLPLNLRQWLEHHPQVASSPFFASLVHELTAAPGARSTAFKQELLAAPPHTQRALLEERVIEELAAVLRTTSARITSSTRFGAVGLDSLTSLELRNRLERCLGESIPAAAILTHPSAAQLAAYLAAKMQIALEEEAPVSGTVPKAHERADDVALDVIPASVRDLSDEEAEAALLDVLAVIDGDT